MSDGIDAYRQALLAQAELARGDLDEIEDHLRQLAADLQASGMPSAEAIREACRRLGAPADVAREHARVRSPFGAKLPASRAWSAALLLLPWWLSFAKLTLREGGPSLTSLFGANLVISTLALGGLVARKSWARAMIVGALSWFVLDQALAFAWSGPSNVWRVACLTGAFAFLVPWRRAELGTAGYMLVLLAWAYHGANILGIFQLTGPDKIVFVEPAGNVAFLATLAAGIATLLRARWAALAAATACIALVVGFANIHALTFRFGDPTLAKIDYLGGLAAGALAAAVVASIGWRRARTLFVWST